jgi:hypothetical protein
MAQPHNHMRIAVDFGMFQIRGNMICLTWIQLALKSSTVGTQSRQTFGWILVCFAEYELELEIGQCRGGLLHEADVFEL